MADYAIHDTTLYDIADVIRKKEGSSALIDPADYAGRVNLMGMLEEKTVSGSIVAFADGADAVKLKSCAVTIAPNLTGISSVDVVHIGKNLLPPADNDIWEVGNINASGEDTSGNSYRRTKDYIPVKNTDLFNLMMSGVINSGASDRFRIFRYDANKNFVSYANYGSQTYPRYNVIGISYIRIRYEYETVTFSNSAMIEYRAVGETEPTSYEPYIEPTTHTANLGRTIYGGTADIVNGTGTETHKEIAFSDLTWTYDSTYSRFLSSAVSGIKIQSGRTLPMVCDPYTVIDDGRTIANVPDMSIYNSGNSGGFYVHDARYTTVEDFLQNMGNTVVCYPLATPETFTFTAVPIISRLGDNTMWGDGDLSVVYRSSGTQTLIPPTLISKTITANGTYTASDEDADGYDTVTVNVSGGGGGNTPQATQTLICDNSALGSSLTFTDDYENYDLIKFVVYRSDIENQFTFYMTPAMINAMGQYSSNRINFNQPYGNNFVCYTKTSNTAWTRYGVRNLAVKYVYGLTFTNCTVTETELYNRQGIGSSNVTFTPPTGESFLDYDYILLATCTGNSDETQVNLEIFQPDIEKDIFGSDNADENAVRVYKYNHGGTFVTVTENTITAFSYFYACGLKLSYNQQNLLGGFNSNSEQGEQENEIENELDELEQEESET